VKFDIYDFGNYIEQCIEAYQTFIAVLDSIWVDFALSLCSHFIAESEAMNFNYKVNL